MNLEKLYEGIHADQDRARLGHERKDDLKLVRDAEDNLVKARRNLDAALLGGHETAIASFRSDVARAERELTRRAVELATVDAKLAALNAPEPPARDAAATPPKRASHLDEVLASRRELRASRHPETGEPVNPLMRPRPDDDPDEQAPKHFGDELDGITIERPR